MSHESLLKRVTLPFKSEQQRKFLYARKPEVARKFQAHEPKSELKAIRKRTRRVKRGY